MLISVNLTAQSTEWLNTTQGSSHEFSNDIAIDDSGNIYQVGSFIGTVDFDPTSGVSSFTSNGNYEDCFIRKLITSLLFNASRSAEVAQALYFFTP